MAEESSPSLKEQLSRLEQLLREKQETCSAVLKTVEERKDAKKRRRETKDSKRERLQQQLARVASEIKEAEAINQQNEASGTGEVFIPNNAHSLVEIVKQMC